MRRHPSRRCVGVPSQSSVRELRRPGVIRNDDSGFTLVELMIVIVILPLITGAIAVSLIAVFKFQTPSENRISNSGDAQVSSASFVRDVQNAAEITTKPSLACGTSVAQIVSLSPDSNENTVITYSESAEGSNQALFRSVCVGGTLQSTSVASHNVQSSLTPSIICASTASTSCTGPMSYSNTWAAAAGISNVSFAVTETTSTETFNYTLAGVPRAWTAASGESDFGWHDRPAVDSGSCEPVS